MMYFIFAQWQVETEPMYNYQIVRFWGKSTSMFPLIFGTVLCSFSHVKKCAQYEHITKLQKHVIATC